jgi:hypothetical protein
VTPFFPYDTQEIPVTRLFSFAALAVAACGRLQQVQFLEHWLDAGLRRRTGQVQRPTSSGAASVVNTKTTSLSSRRTARP